MFSYLCGEDGIYQILAGGVMLGAFFMATDYVTTPVTKTGKVIFISSIENETPSG